MNEIDNNSPVLVTGATGYLAGWIVKNLLESGLTVHAAVRDASNTEKRAHLDKIAENCNGQIKYFESDLLENGSYKDAMDGCQIVFHTASPFVMDADDPKKDVIDPAFNGTRNVLNTVNETSSVKRVVLTSSVAAIYGDAIDSELVPGGVFDETMWNTTSTESINEYSYSKTIAEKEAWAMCELQKRWDLIVINPSFVIGPSLNPNATFESKKFMLQMGNGDLKMGVPKITMGMVDVRDVGDAHINAAFNPDSEGRYIISSGSFSLLDIGKMLREKHGDKYPIPKSLAPKIMIWLLAPFIGIKRNFVSRNVGYGVELNNNRSKNDLSIEYTPIKKAAIDFFQQFIDNKLL